MRKYTFIAEYKGGTYISQYSSVSLTDALFVWADNLDSQFFTDKAKIKILEKVKDSDFHPMPIATVDNVWCSSYVIYRSLLLLNIVETV